MEAPKSIHLDLESTYSRGYYQAMAAVAFRQVQARFHGRGKAAWENHLASGRVVAADEVLDKLQARLNVRRWQLGA